MFTPLFLGFGEEVDVAISFGIGALTFVILMIMVGALIAFGGGREHS